MKNIFWKNYKLHLIAKCIQPSEKIRVKFYRAINIYNNLKSFSNDYLEGFLDGARLDTDTRAFIKFIIQIQSDT